MTTTAAQDGLDTIAGRISLNDVMARLSRQRPVFHSEADLQHSFARALWELAPEVRSRLEVPQRQSGRRREYLDLLCIGPSHRTAIEFKYFTRSWTGASVEEGEGSEGPEEYALRAHGATDLARLYFLRDIARLERFCSRTDQNGLAILVTNEPLLWTPPEPQARRTRDHHFRVHQGRELSGTLLWAEGAYPKNTLTLRGSYPLAWTPYSRLDGLGGEFHYLAVPVDPQPTGAAEAPTTE